MTANASSVHRPESPHLSQSNQAHLASANRVYLCRSIAFSCGTLKLHEIQDGLFSVEGIRSVEHNLFNFCSAVFVYMHTDRAGQPHLQPCARPR